MPIVRIEIYKGFSEEYMKEVLSGVHEALVHSFKIPEDDRNQIINEHDEANFERSGNKTKQFTIIEITAFKGRTREAKRELYKRIIENLQKKPGIRPMDVLITIHEPDLVNWGVAGGKCADEVDLEFKINA
jgi:phenylpyruvate tautomerase PptA (4-oxalocrotonate tautomerase family)